MVAKRLSYKVKSTPAARDGSALIDLTAVVEDILEAGHEGATLHFSIRAIRKRHHRRSQGRQSHSDSHVSSDRKKQSANDATQTGNDAILVIYSKDRKFFSKFSAALGAKATEMKNVDNETMENLPTRDKRGASKTSGTKRRHKVDGECRQLDFTIDFETIGWDKWIIYPSSFQAYRCGGKCRHPLIQAFNPTNHAVLQSLMRKRDRNSAHWPCCVATKLQPISMLYYEHEEIVVRRHEDMVADQCSCR